MSYSLVAHTDPGGNPWKSAFDDLAYDPIRKRVLLSCRTARKGANIYAVPVETFAKGGLTLDKLEPVFSAQGIVRGIVVVPGEDR